MATRQKPKRLKIIFEKAKRLTPEQKKGILAVKAKVLAISEPAPQKSVEVIKSVTPSISYEIPKPTLVSPSSAPRKAQKTIPVVKSIAQDESSAVQIESALKQGVDHIYTKHGLMGLGKVEGIETPEWQFMSKLNASKILAYYTGDSAASSLSADIVTKLSKSEQHYKLVEEVRSLIEQTGGTLKPGGEETVGDFLKRLIAVALKSSKV